MAVIPHRTMYRWLADADFMAAYPAARRQVFDDAMFCLERNAVAAAQALVDEFGPERIGSFSLISATTRVFDLLSRRRESSRSKRSWPNCAR